MKIAIIGSGVSGLVSAYLLSRKYEVTIFEKENRAGGHANTVSVTTENATRPPNSRPRTVTTGIKIFFNT